jgi:ubiquitin-like domain-containing CTD phosphatase 1
MSSSLLFKWNGKELEITADQSQTVGDVKSMLEVKTTINPKRQKLIGLKTKDGKLATDDSIVSHLLLKPGVKIMLMGSVLSVT